MAYEGPVLPISHGGTGSSAGSAANLINLNATQLTSGTIPTGRIPAATSGAIGGVIVGSNINVSAGTISLNSASITGALTFTPENVASKNASGGYAGLDGSSLLTASQLPLATGATRGSVIVGSNITNTGGTISLTSGNVTTALTFTPLNAAGDSMTAGFLTLFQDPSSPMHAATKQYVDNMATGLDVKASVRLATTANITLSGTQTIDGVAAVAGNRILVKDQSTGSQNGIYVVAAGAWSRSTDADISSEVTTGMFTFVEEGTANIGTGWLLNTANPITLGTTSLTFVQFSSAGIILAGNGLQKSGNTISVLNSDSTITVAVGGISVGTASITNTHIGASAAIAYSKLALTGAILNADLAGSIADTKLSTISTAGKVADTALSSNVKLLNTSQTYTAGDTYTVAGTQLKFGAAVNQGTLNASASLAGMAFQADWNGTTWTARGTTSSQVQFAGSTIQFFVDSGLTSGSTFTPSSRFTINGTGASGDGSQLTNLNGSNVATGTVSNARLPIATASATGIVKAGSGLSVDGAGLLTVNTGTMLLTTRVVVAAGAVTAASTDDIIVINKTVAAATTVNLPSSPSTGLRIMVKDGKGDAATNNITLTPAAGTIDGQATAVMDSNYSCRVMVYNGTEWNLI